MKLRCLSLALCVACIATVLAPLAHAQAAVVKDSALGAAPQLAETTWQVLIQQGQAARATGNLLESMQTLTVARDSAIDAEQRRAANAELGATLLQAQRFGDAAVVLKEAYAGSSGLDRARIALDLGNLAAATRDKASAKRFYLEAAEAGAALPAVALGARLNLARLTATPERGAVLYPLLPSIRQLADPVERGRYLLNFGKQAGTLKAGLPLAFEALSAGREAADATNNPRLMVEARDALAQLYEEQKRLDDALLLNNAALARTAGIPLGLVQDLLIRLEWRQSRLLSATGHADEALAAMQRAAAHVEAVRQDLPIEADDGRTSFESLLRPIYIGLADLILKHQGGGEKDARASSAAAAINALELSRQAEMQDYLGERCSVLAATNGEQGLPAGVAVLYPLVLDDRLELLLKTANGATRQQVATKAANLRRLTADMADGLRSYNSDDYLGPAQQLYNVLLRPLQGDLDANRITTLVVASEGFLRPIPLSALHDGKKFLIEKYALSTVTGLSMTDQSAPDGATVSSLVAGLSEPGPVLDKLDKTKLGAVTEVAETNTANAKASKADVSRGLHLRSMRALDRSGIAPNQSPDAQRSALHNALMLPGVETELAAITTTLNGKRLLNGEFTVGHFRNEATTGSYRILHIASHGIFGGDASSSFILAYDDILTMNGLQTLLTADNFKQSPIELLTLSACETAEGNERAPLGFSGAAIKARARSALGTLWPVSDDAARQVMDSFYSGLSAKKLGKAAALREAQLGLLQQPATAHPFFWAPFTLVGNWK